MPKTAATITGLVLAAGSIGFNMVRYPVVSEMVGPVLATAPSGDSIQSPTVSLPAPADMRVDAGRLAAESQSPVAVTRQPAPIPSVEVKPVPDMAREIAEPAATMADPAAKITISDKETTTAQATNPERPLVPVSTVAMSAEPMAGGLGPAVRRLPPVDDAAGNATRNLQSAEGPLPIYPSTGIR